MFLLQDPDSHKDLGLVVSKFDPNPPSPFSSSMMSREASVEIVALFIKRCIPRLGSLVKVLLSDMLAKCFVLFPNKFGL